MEASLSVYHQSTKTMLQNYNKNAHSSAMSGYGYVHENGENIELKPVLSESLCDQMHKSKNNFRYPKCLQSMITITCTCTHTCKGCTQNTTTIACGNHKIMKGRM